MQGQHIGDYGDEDDQGDLHLYPLRGTEIIKLKFPSFVNVGSADKYFDWEGWIERLFDYHEYDDA